MVIAVTISDRRRVLKQTERSTLADLRVTLVPIPAPGAMVMLGGSPVLQERIRALPHLPRHAIVRRFNSHHSSSP